MTTINTIQDLQRILVEHPEWRNTFRQILLTEELLELPQRIDALTSAVDTLATALAQHIEATNRRLDNVENRLDALESTVATLVQHAEATNRRLDAMDRRLDAMDRRLDNVENRLDSLEEAVAALVQHAEATNRRLDAMDRRLDNMENRLDSLEEAVAALVQQSEEANQRMASLDKAVAALVQQTEATNRRLDAMERRTNQSINHIGELKGLFMEHIARDDAYIIARDMGLQWKKTLERKDIGEIADAAQRGGLTDDISRDFMRAFYRSDMIFEAVDNDGTTCYAAVEISYTADQRDTNRAMRHADYLTRFTGIPAYAAIASIYTDNRIENILTEDTPQPQTASQDAKVFWSRLPELEQPS